MSVRDHRTGYAHNKRTKQARELWETPTTTKYKRGRIAALQGSKKERGKTYGYNGELK